MNSPSKNLRAASEPHPRALIRRSAELPVGPQRELAERFAGVALAVQELAVEEKVSSSRVGLVRARVEGVVAQTICPKFLWKCGWNM